MTYSLAEDAKSAVRWLLEQPGWRRGGVQWAVLDLSGAYKAAYNQALPDAVQVADPFHVVGVANRCLTLTRRRVQEEPAGTGDGSPIPSSECETSAPSPLRNSTATAAKNYAACSKRATPTGKSA